MYENDYNAYKLPMSYQESLLKRFSLSRCKEKTSVEISFHTMNESSLLLVRSPCGNAVEPIWFQIMKFLQCHVVVLSERNGDCSDEASINDLTGRSIAVASRTGGGGHISYTYKVAANLLKTLKCSRKTLAFALCVITIRSVFGSCNSLFFATLLFGRTSHLNLQNRTTNIIKSL